MPRDRRRRATIEIYRPYVIKRFVDKARASNEISYYLAVPWAAPTLLDYDERALKIERLPLARQLPLWRPAQELRDLLQRLHAIDIHHRDVHIGNVVQAHDHKPILIDWESAITQTSRFSYDLDGPEVSGVPIPDIHQECGAQWWSSPGSWSIGEKWERNVSARMARRARVRQR